MDSDRQHATGQAERSRKNIRTALLLAAAALFVYIGFILITAWT